MNPSLETYILTVLKMPAKAEFVTRLNNLSGLSGTPMSPLLTKWVQQNFGLASVAAIQNWSAGKFSPEMLLRWTSVFPSEFQGGAIRADLYESLTGSGVVPVVLLLDAYPGAGAAYSVRKLSSSYTGAALRVRRLSDNVEQDIGFIGFDLDTNAMTTFAGPGGNLAISIWYDQTGNGRNMIQTTAASQPYIVNSGVIYLRNGNISIFFNSNNLNVLSSTYFLNQQSSFVVSNMNGTTSTFSQIGLAQSQYFELAGYYSSSWGSFNTPGYGSIITTSPSVVDYGTGALSVTNNTTYLTYLNWNGNLTPRKYRKNGVALANSANTGSNIRTGTISRVFSNGYLSEIIIYPSDQASNVVGIETNINGYYNIYP